MKTLTQPLKTHGGKKYLAKRIVSLFPKHLHFVELFCGGCAVLLARDPNRDWFIDEEWKRKNGEKVPAHLRGCSEVVNDLNGMLTCFWRTLQSPIEFANFQRTVNAVPFSSREYEEAPLRGGVNYMEKYPVPSSVAFFIRARQSMAGRGDCFTPLTRNRTRGGRNAEANAWLNCIEGLPEIHERLKGVVILNDDACKVIRQQDGENTLYYADPPYMHQVRSSTGEYGEFEMNENDHSKLLCTLADIDGKFILSGYRSELYDDVASTWGWHRVDIEIDNKASSAKKKKKQTECLWVNYELKPECT